MRAMEKREVKARQGRLGVIGRRVEGRFVVLLERLQ